MKTFETKLYSFDELSKEAQKNAIESERANVAEWRDAITNEDYNKTLEAFEEATGAKIVRMESQVGGCGHHYTFNFGDYGVMGENGYELYEQDITGKLLWRWVTRFIDENRRGKYRGCKNGKTVRSKIIAEDMDEFMTSLTGFYSDCAIITPIAYAYSNPQKIFGNPALTLRSLINECFQSFFSQWEEELYDNYSNDNVICEELRHSSKYEDSFLENGTFFEAA